MKNSFKGIILQICKENGIKYKLLSKDWVIMLEKGGKTRYICGYKFDLNGHGTGLITDDKFALYEVLKAKGIPVIEHNIVYNKDNHYDYAITCNTYEYVKDYFLKQNQNIVIKPNNGMCGNDVFNITDINEIDKILDKLFIKNFSISICPFYNIKHEYRVVMLDGESKLVYRKYLPIVIGDGKKTIRELLLEFNNDYFQDKLQDSKYDRILSKYEKFQYDWKFNLSQGAIAKKLEDKELYEKLINLAKQVCRETNLKFASVDIIETTNGDLLVLEANSGVTIDKYVSLNPDEYITAKEIYASAIEKLFNN